MSDTEYHYGKLRKVDLQGKTKEEFFKEQCRLEDIELEEYYDNYEEAWRSETDNHDKYFIGGDDVYETFDHIEGNSSEDIDVMIPHEDGSFTFVMSFYNGGTCLSECLQRSLEEKLKTNE